MVHVDPAALGIPLDELRAFPEAVAIGHERREADLVAELVAGARPVDEHGREVHERIAERGHLPVEDGAYPRVDRVDDGIVEPIVAVDDRPRQVCGQRLHASAQPREQLIDRRQLARLAQLPLLCPARHLPREEPLRPAEIAEPHLAGIDGVEVSEHVDQLGRQR